MWIDKTNIYALVQNKKADKQKHKVKKIAGNRTNDCTDRREKGIFIERTV